jgi:hypothetical protein
MRTMRPTVERSTAITVPPGQWGVSFHGIELLVPKAFQKGKSRCGAFSMDGVGIEMSSGFAVPACLSSQPADVTVVHLYELPSGMRQPNYRPWPTGR